MQAKSSAVIVLAAAIVLGALILVFSPMFWSDHVVVDLSKPVPSNCSITTTPLAPSGALIVAHCPFWVKYPS